MKKIIICLSIALLIIVICTSFSTFAASETISGKWGKLTWKLNENTGEMTVSGSGQMNEFQSMSYAWRDYAKSIKNLVIGEGITSIGSCAFAALPFFFLTARANK